MNTGWPCPDPEFCRLAGTWGPCVRCGRLAWDHEQADPLADMRAAITADRLGLPPGQVPPVMRTAAPPPPTK